LEAYRSEIAKDSGLGLDPRSALQWIAGRLPGNNRDAALQITLEILEAMYVQGWVKSDPA